MHDSRIHGFLATVSRTDGFQALSEAKIEALSSRECVIVIEEADEVVAVGVTSRHVQLDGSSHWAVETALAPGLRFPAFEDRLVDAALSLVPSTASTSVWSRRRSLDAALERAGFEPVRELAHFTIELPIEQSAHGIETRTLRPSDTRAVVALNRSAFASHREAAALDEAELERLVGQEGLGPLGFLILEESDKIVGFCWRSEEHTAELESH